MAMPRKSDHRISVKQLVQQQRDGLYATGHQNLNMALPQPVIDHLDALKRRYDFRSRDAVVVRVIATSKATLSPDVFALRAADAGTIFRRISPIVPNELVDYVKQIQQRFRNIAYGPIFEMMVAEVGHDGSHPAFQRELIQGALPSAMGATA
jgi:hypothetical protein